jgi:hypothetical protein
MTKSKSQKDRSTTATQAPTKPEKKTETVIALLRRDGGASLTEITDATVWLPHTARAVLTGFRKKGYVIAKAKADGVTRWSITSGPAA